MSSGTDEVWGTSYDLTDPADHLRWLQDSLRIAEEDLVHIEEDTVRLASKRRATCARIEECQKLLSELTNKVP